MSSKFGGPAAGSQPAELEGEEAREAREAREEREALGKIVRAFKAYGEHAEWEVARWERNYERMPERHRALLPHVPQKCARARQCVKSNEHFITAMLAAFDSENGPVPPHLADASRAAECGEGQALHVTPGDIDKVHYVLKNLMRDWSEDGAVERAQSYGRVLAEIKRIFADWADVENSPPRILVPGAGLGRLCLDIASLGFEVQGNEFSYFMLLCSSFVLNHTLEANQWTIFPWVHNSNNNISDEDQLRAVPVPEVCPYSLVPRAGLLSMCAGDFVEVYSAPDMQGAFDCIATNFFIDTAHNIIQYLEIIAGCLKEGGYWVNLGPLLYHWADSHLYLGADEMSVEVSLEDVKMISASLGLRLVREDSVKACYTTSQRSMFQTTYNCAFWTMVKDSSLASAPAPAPTLPAK